MSLHARDTTANRHLGQNEININTQADEKWKTQEDRTCSGMAEILVTGT